MTELNDLDLPCRGAMCRAPHLIVTYNYTNRPSPTLLVVMASAHVILNQLKDARGNLRMGK